MKILHLTPAYKPAFVYGGPTMSVARLCEALQYESQQQINPNSNTRPIEIEVFCTKANGQQELPIPSGISQIVDGVKVTYFNRITKDHTHFSPALLWALWKKIKKEKKQYRKGEFQVHIHSWWNLVVLFGALICKMHRVPIVCSPRGMVTSYTQTNNNSLIKRLIHSLFAKKLLHSMHLVASSVKELEDFLTIAKPLGATIIPNIVELHKNLLQKVILQSKKNSSNELKLLFLSRVEQKKGLNLLIQSLAQVNFPWTLTIAGSGEDFYVQKLKEQIQNLDLTTKVNWIGHQNNEQKFEVLANHDLLCLTSYNENFANVVIESLAVGTPVLISEHVGLASFVQENKLGFICKLNAEDISQSLNKAYQEKNYRENIRLQAPNIIQREFDETSLAKKYLNIYKNIVDLSKGQFM